MPRVAFERSGSVILDGRLSSEDSDPAYVPPKNRNFGRVFFKPSRCGLSASFQSLIAFFGQANLAIPKNIPHCSNVEAIFCGDTRMAPMPQIWARATKM